MSDGYWRRCAVVWMAGAMSLAGVAQAQTGTTQTGTTQTQTQPGAQTGTQTGGRAVHGANGITLPAPPSTEKHPVTDTLHGDTITDNYRWLEDQKAPATRAWLEQQDEYTQQYLAQVKMRAEITADLTNLMRVESYSVPQLRGDRYFFKKRLPEENQGSLYMRSGMASADEKLVDAAKLSADQNTSIDIEDISNDGALLVYGIRQGGADEVAIHVLDVAKRQELPDQLVSQRYMGVQISPDKKGLYYSLFTHAGTLVYWHAFGTLQSADKVIFGKEYQGEKLGELDLVGISISDNGHWLILTIDHGVPAKRADILLKDLRQPDAPVVALVYGIDNRFSLLDAGRDEFLVQTDWKAQNGRILLADMKAKPDAWKTIVPEGKNVIESASVVGGKLFVDRLADVKSETTIYTLDGTQVGRLSYPGIGTGSVVHGKPLAKEGFYTFQSFNVPPTIYRYETESAKSEVFAAPKVPFDSAKYEVRQVFYTSKDGTRVPMFIAGKKGMALTGKTQVLMTAYGGFNVSMTAGWNPMYA
ncbi:MAG: hypothetical protein ACR2JE_10560 [Acidobacteriaceae bacterium]